MSDQNALVLLRARSHDMIRVTFYPRSFPLSLPRREFPRPKVMRRKRKKKELTVLLLRLAKTQPSISIRLNNATKSTEPNQRSRDERKVQLAFNFRLRRSPLDHSRLYCLLADYTAQCPSAV